MGSSAKNVKLGVCDVFFNGQNLGYTKGGVSVEVATNTHEVQVDQHGETPISEIITGRTITATVPLAETTLENMVAIMPGSELVTDGVKATGTVTFATAAPAEGDTVTIGGVVFTFTDTIEDNFDLAVPASIDEAASALAEAITLWHPDYEATASAAVVTVSAYQTGVSGNATVLTDGTNITVANLTGGVDATKAQVMVSTGINLNLIDLAQTLVLRPKNTNGEEDLTIYRAMCPGALNFAYETDNERVYSAAFKGYAGEDGSLFALGDTTATA